MFPVRRCILLAALGLILATTACGGGGRAGVSWADLTLVGEENYILVSYNDYMVLIDPANGTPVQLRDNTGQIRTNADGSPRQWEIVGRDTKSRFFTTPLWLDEERLLVLDYERRLLVVSFADACLSNLGGACVDNYTQIALPGRGIADMASANGRIFVALSEDGLIAFDLENLDTGEPTWTFGTDRGVWAAPVVVDDGVYFSGMDHYLYAVNGTTGEQLWRVDLGSALVAAPLYYAGGEGEDATPRLYVSSLGRKIFEISIINGVGEITAEYLTEDWVWSTPVLFESVLYVTDMGGYIYALDSNNQLAELWKVNINAGGIRPSPLVVDNYVIVASRNGRVSWRDRATGDEVLFQDVNAEILAELLLVERADETLVVVSTVKKEKTLVAFTLEGAPRWTYQR